MANISNIRIGACSLTWNGVDLGHTKDGATFTFERSFEPLTVDKYGETPIDLVLTGNSMKIEVMIAEPVVEVLKNAVPEGGYLSATYKRLSLGTDAGASLRTSAAELVLHPLARGTTDYSEDITIYKAVSSEPLELPYKVDGQRVYSVTFTALVDESYTSTRRLGHIGYTNIS